MILSHPYLWRLVTMTGSTAVSLWKWSCVGTSAGSADSLFCSLRSRTANWLDTWRTFFPSFLFSISRKSTLEEKKKTNHKPTSGHTEVRCAFNYEIKVLKLVEQKCELRMKCCVVNVRTCIWTKMLWDNYPSCCVPPRLAAGEAFSSHQAVYRFPQLYFW